MKYVTKTFNEYTIYACIVNVESGKLKETDLEPIKLFNEKFTYRKILGLLRKKYGTKNQYIVKKKEVKKITYRMETSKFFEMAEKI